MLLKRKEKADQEPQAGERFKGLRVGPRPNSKPISDGPYQSFPNESAMGRDPPRGNPERVLFGLVSQTVDTEPSFTWASEPSFWLSFSFGFRPDLDRTTALIFIADRSSCSTLRSSPFLAIESLRHPALVLAIPRAQPLNQAKTLASSADSKHGRRWTRSKLPRTRRQVQEVHSWR
jgi:hypothetical protein